MGILLIHPPLRTKDRNLRHGVKSTSSPLSLFHLAAYAERAGQHVRVMDVNAEELQFDEMEAVVREQQPAWVGLTAEIAQIHSARRVDQIGKRISPDSGVT